MPTIKETGISFAIIVMHITVHVFTSCSVTVGTEAKAMSWHGRMYSRPFLPICPLSWSAESIGVWVNADGPASSPILFGLLRGISTLFPGPLALQNSYKEFFKSGYKVTSRSVFLGGFRWRTIIFLILSYTSYPVVLSLGHDYKKKKPNSKVPLSTDSIFFA